MKLVPISGLLAAMLVPLSFAAPAAAGPGPAVPPASTPTPPPKSGVVIRWAGAGSADLARNLLQDAPMQVLEAGGSASLEQDRDTLTRADLGLPVVVLTRRWPESVEAELAEQYTLIRNATDKAAIGNNLISFGQISNEFPVFFSPLTLGSPDDEVKHQRKSYDNK